MNNEYFNPKICTIAEENRVENVNERYRIANVFAPILADSGSRDLEVWKFCADENAKNMRIKQHDRKNTFRICFFVLNAKAIFVKVRKINKNTKLGE